MVKLTFTVDEDTAARLRRIASRLARPQSRVVRDAIRDYGERVGRLDEEERERLLRAFDTLVPRIPGRPVAEVDAEIAAVRAARRRGGRRTPPRPA
jgi:hypothetical protein